MSTAIRRKPLTDAVLAAIRGLTLPDSTPMLAEVGSMPLGAGWGTSQPNDPLGPGFAPYYVLTTMTAVPSQDAGSLAAPQEDWHIPYMVQSFGVAHQQAEWAGDEARTALDGLRGTILALGASNYRISQIWTSQIGGINRVPDSDPPYFSQQDGFTLWVAKRST
jgi:hypothetical protein